MMYEIFILLIALIAMARKGRRRRSMGRYIRGPVDEELDLGTLAARTLIGANFDSVVNERTLVSSLVATWALSDVTVATGDGPVLVGVAHSDYSDSEIESWIEVTNSWNEGDLVGQEVANRKCRRVGVFESKDLAAETAVLNDGKPIKTRLNWILLQAQTLKVWAYNMGSSPFATTNPTLRVAGHANLFPK